MRKIQSSMLGSLPCRLAPAIAGAAAGLASLTGCVTTHTIAPDQLPAALETAPGQDQRRIVRGDDGKPVELPSPEHLRWVQIETRSAEAAETFRPPVTAWLASDGLHVDGEEGARIYPPHTITSVRIRHDDHKADTIGGVVLLSVGVSWLASAAGFVILDFTRGCQDDLCMTGLLSMVYGVPAGVVGLAFAIPGVILTVRGASGLGTPPQNQAARSAVPEIAVGPGSAVVTVPF
jgi:hypothetical protein